MNISIWIPGEAGQFPNYIAAVEAAGGRAVCGTQADCDALLLPGGGDMEPWRYGQENTASHSLDPARDALELDALEWYMLLGRPVLGICRGFQTINVFFGGDLQQDIPGHSQIEGVDRLHATTAAPGSFLYALYGSTPVVNSAHHQAVGRLGNGLQAVQWTADGVVEGLRHDTLPIWAVQWHPERLTGTFARPDAADGGALFRFFLEKIRETAESR